MPNGNREYWIATRAINDQNMLAIAGEEIKKLAYESGYNMRDVLITVHNHMNIFIVVGTALIARDNLSAFGNVDVGAEMMKLLTAA